MVRTQISLPKPVLEQLKEQSRVLDVSMAELIRRALAGNLPQRDAKGAQ